MYAMNGLQDMAKIKPKERGNRESFEDVASQIEETRPFDDVLRKLLKDKPHPQKKAKKE